MNTNSPLDMRRGRRKWLLLAIPLAALVLWLVGVGVFRQTTPKSDAVATVQAPAALNTAADYLAQGDYDAWTGNLDKALAAYSRAIELNPALAEAYNNRAYTYMVQEDYARALTDLNKALELRPNYVNALMNRGDIYNYYYEMDYGRAVADYDRVLAIDPEAPRHTSVCGHRLLALNHGWGIGVFTELLAHGTSAGCGSAPQP